MKFLITGITGFTGPHLANILLKEGHTVYGLYRNENYLDISDVLKENIKKINFIKCDLLDKDNIYNIIKENKFDGVFHLAAYTHPSNSFDNPELVFNTNTTGTMALCESIRKYSPDCVLMYCSTAEVYGIYPENVLIKENFALNPISPYAVSKASSELFVAERTKNNMIQGFVTRAFSHTGPRRRHNYCLSSDAIQIARILLNKQDKIIKVGNLASKRATMHVNDVVQTYYDLMIRKINYNMNNGEVFNISNDTPHEIGYYLNMMLEMYNLINVVKLEPDPKLFRKIDLPLQRADCTKIKEFMNWKLATPISTALHDLVEYWKEYEWRVK
jgi:GDP-4-dehydro-6-deoxy-D-mannose reductase